MASNLTNVDPQMQQLAESAVIAAKDKFGVTLDFSENSLQQLDTLLQQAHEGYKQTSSSENSPNIPIDNTVRVWGSYFGEVIRRSLGGDWIVDQNNIYLQLGSKRLNPLGQVRSWIKIGTQHDIQGYFEKLSIALEQYHPQLENEPSAKQPISGNEPSIQIGQSSWNKCPYCGREFQGRNAAYCPNCGKGLVDVSPMKSIKTKICPYCAEEIQEAAIICKYCGRDLGPTLSSTSPGKNRALVKCTDCGNEISPEAESCPHCGKPSSKLHCPFCKSTNVVKKTSGQLAAHALGQIFGAGPYARPPKLYYCNNCKHSF
jgi:hypothetical protein